MWPDKSGPTCCTEHTAESVYRPWSLSSLSFRILGLGLHPASEIELESGLRWTRRA